ncbi:hypothetical protein D584_23723 [Brucella intermedia M86]|uniref:Uncharacterized protein n=1 Tax=Brucella intermedia M86 TaxID=1234597 RepID=M5JU00_9HYPH|nr:hypothetical protein D584_23723 [Brucella intermedia M86]
MVVTDLFAAKDYHLHVDEPFAVMALCPQHRFRLKTAFPERYHTYVRTIADDRSEYMTWLMSASSILSELGRWREGTGDGPAWPLKNVELAPPN